MSYDSMEAEHRKDYAFKRLLDDADRALLRITADDAAHIRLGGRTTEEIENVRAQLQKRSDHIVAVWN